MLVSLIAAVPRGAVLRGRLGYTGGRRARGEQPVACPGSAGGHQRRPGAAHAAPMAVRRSMGIDLLGFIAQLVALQRASAVRGPGDGGGQPRGDRGPRHVVIGATLSLREWLAVGGVVAGVGLLGCPPGPRAPATRARPSRSRLIVATAVLGLGGMVAARLLRDPARTLVLGRRAGFGFGAVGVAARVLDGFAPLTLLRDPAAYAVAAGQASCPSSSTRPRSRAAASPSPPRPSCSPRRCPAGPRPGCSSSVTRPGRA